MHLKLRFFLVFYRTLVDTVYSLKDQVRMLEKVIIINVMYAEKEKLYVNVNRFKWLEHYYM